MTKTSSRSTLVLAALGIVYGDIGTSPLYAFKEAFVAEHGLSASPEHVLVTLSALFWAVTLVISIKYVWVVLRHDNDGEGGVLALTALAHRASSQRPRLASAVILLGVFAAALFYGDAIITPAISVLSAIEGVAVAAPRLSDWVLPLTIGILCGLFVVQRSRWCGFSPLARWAFRASGKPRRYWPRSTRGTHCNLRCISPTPRSCCSARYSWR